MPSRSKKAGLQDIKEFIRIETSKNALEQNNYQFFLENRLYPYQCGCMYSYHQVTKITYYCTHVRRWPCSWIKKPQGIGMIKKTTYKGIQHEEFIEGPDNHWIGDYTRSYSRYPKNWLEGVYIRLSRNQKNNFLLPYCLLSQSQLYFLLRSSRQLLISLLDCISTPDKKIYIPKL